MAEIDVWRAIAGELSARRAVALVAVVDGQGSSPGKPGAILAVGAAGPLAGTVGGGQGEAQAIGQAMTLIRQGGFAPQHVLQRLRPQSEGGDGMCCGGQQRLVFVALHPDDRGAIDSLLARLAAGRQATWQLSSKGWEMPVDHRPAGWWQDAADWRYTRIAGPACCVWLVGGGHVSLALSALLRGLDFGVVVGEERPGIASFAANHHAHVRLAVPYEDLAARIPEGANTFVGIMTHDWRRDARVLHRLAGKSFGYLGLLGSQDKLARLLGKVAPTDFFHAPMGLPIGSHTPAEIAVSIAAEMIAVRQRQGENPPFTDL